MGMYDTIYCHRDLGPGFYKRELQTKSLDCCMAEYFLDPDGQLWEIDYSYTHDFVDVPEEERSAPWNVFEAVPNGKHGKIRPAKVNALVETYPARWDAHYAKWPSVYLYFKDGKIQDVIRPQPEVDNNPKAYLDIPSY
jgi:hypothetical protein